MHVLRTSPRLVRFVMAWSVLALGVAIASPMLRPAGTAGIRESDTSPRLALLRKLSASDSVYVAYSTGIAPNQASSASGQSLPSRASRQYEAGWKSLWNGGRLQSDIAVYRLQQTHLLADDPSTPNICDKTIAGTGRSQGIEASLSGDLSRRVGVAVAYAYTDAR